ncbi:MAG: hypothetical protein CVU59_09930 [Deltaproteobacteria bacterium HGW-Deltaproteobacteria-17]|nr:MAG: hypothetical protein CVU59_09930 [Deltaproteobacteria bacterium HGW-Deltaproteobacteria-17]
MIKTFSSWVLVTFSIFSLGCSFDTAGLPDPSGNVNNFNNINNILNPSCSDGITNQDETDADCGGDLCDPCDTGRSCLSHTDCASAFCDGTGHCAIPQSCTDELTNGAETDVDCGGNDCDPCADDLACLVETDCLSGYCNPDNRCSTPICSDAWVNGDETDLNCGGGTCPACANGLDCLVRSDCASSVCLGLVCQVPTCSDSTQNAYETDVDCGGFTCDRCADGLGCLQHSDCDSGFCDGGFCGAVTSCKNLRALVPEAVSGVYTITTTLAPVEVYCHIDGGTANTFAYVTNGLSTSRTTDNDSCKAVGMTIFTPRTADLYGLARDVALAHGIPTTGGFLGPLGIYNPNNGVTTIGSNNWCGSVYKVCCDKKMIGGGADDTVSRSDCGFTSLAAGGAFWASESKIGEPSGDYDATCWLRFDYNTAGNVTSWNDQDCDYAYVNYMCMANDDL